MASNDLTRTEREALKAIHRLETRSDGGAHTGALADALAVSAPTVTANLKRLADRGLVDHRPYRGVALTSRGATTAAAAIRRHRIVERFLSDLLGYAWHEADRLAPSFEHELPEEVEDRLFVALGRPTTCPHGFPIPEAGADALLGVVSLYELSPGDEGVVAVPGSTGPEVVELLEANGLRPGAHVVVREKHPFHGPVVVEVAGSTCTLGEPLARHIYVQHDIKRREPAC